MSSKFSEYKKLDLPGVNQEIQKKWEKEGGCSGSYRVHKDTLLGTLRLAPLMTFCCLICMKYAGKFRIFLYFQLSIFYLRFAGLYSVHQPAIILRVIS